MPANRKAIIEAVLALFEDQITAPANDVDDIGRRLLPHFIEAMPIEERANWGVLEKRTSNPYSVPYDILVWKPTLEHFDVLTSSEVSPGIRKLRATWGAVGVLPKTTWHWCDWRATQTPIVPLPKAGTPELDPGTPPTDPPPPVDTSEILRRIAAIEAWIRKPL